MTAGASGGGENPQAFPSTNSAWDMDANRRVYVGEEGMTLRDWFAGQALAGSCAHPDSEGWKDADVAEQCYRVADAMLTTRAKGCEA